ncbi:MAG TPA: hypothetical protein VF691_02545 [Cytophagaceae bacterium]|jgi:hypothetical protein
MGKNKSSLFSRVNGSSILEVIVAMVIIIVIFGIGVMVYNNVTQSSYSYQQFKAALFCREEYNRTIKEKTYFDGESEEEGLTLTKKISPYKGSADLLLFEVEAKNASDIILAKKKSLILIDK